MEQTPHQLENCSIGYGNHSITKGKPFVILCGNCRRRS